MFRLHLVIKQISESVIELSLPISFRIVFAGITILLIASMISLMAIAAVPIIIATITIVAGLYEERWRFDNKRGVVNHWIGILGIAKRSSIEFDAIDSFILSNYKEVPEQSKFSAKRSVALRSLVAFQIGIRSGRAKTVEIRMNRHNDMLKENAERIAEFCNKPLEESS